MDKSKLIIRILVQLFCSINSLNQLVVCHYNIIKRATSTAVAGIRVLRADSRQHPEEGILVGEGNRDTAGGNLVAEDTRKAAVAEDTGWVVPVVRGKDLAAVPVVVGKGWVVGDTGLVAVRVVSDTGRVVVRVVPDTGRVVGRGCTGCTPSAWAGRVGTA
jgi:hypothetical protein